jgi:phosphomannomutase/phosphoglucomutase
MQVNKFMFREYDIRGRESEDELNVESMRHLGKAFGTFLQKRGVTEAIIGHDARGTSEEFHAAAKEGLLSCGINLIDIGLATTPMSYWAQFYFKTKGLFMITASHNPVGWNGVKLGTDLAYTIIGPEVQEVYQSIIDEKYHVSDTQGTVRTENIKDAYIKDIVSRSKITKKFKVLCNTGNGTAGYIAPDMLRAAGCEVVEHFTDIDPTYPNYTPNPDGTGMMGDTAKQTVENGCDLGMAFDGDGDRFGLVDDKGTIIWPDRYMILLSRLVLMKKPGAKIIFDVKVSQALPEDIEAHGGVPIMWKTGHSYIKSKLKEEKAALAGEMSGHIFFVEDFYGFDDGEFAALKILEYLSTQDKKLSEVIEDTPYYESTPTIQVKTTDADKYNVVDELVKEFKDEYGADKVIDINGARVLFGDGWGLVRASSNTPTLVLRFEAKTQEILAEIQAIFKDKLMRFDQVSKDWDTSGH